MSIADIDSPGLKIGESVKFDRVPMTTEDVLWFGKIRDTPKSE